MRAGAEGGKEKEEDHLDRIHLARLAHAGVPVSADKSVDGLDTPQAPLVHIFGLHAELADEPVNLVQNQHGLHAARWREGDNFSLFFSL